MPQMAHFGRKVRRTIACATILRENLVAVLDSDPEAKIGTAFAETPDRHARFPSYARNNIDIFVKMTRKHERGCSIFYKYVKILSQFDAIFIPKKVQMWIYGVKNSAKQAEMGQKPMGATIGTVNCRILLPHPFVYPLFTLYLIRAS